MRGIHGLPDLEIEVDGEPLEEAACRSLASLQVAQRLSSPSRCELVFEELRGPLAEEGLPPGTSLSLKVAGQSVPLFVGETAGLEFSFGPERRRRLRVRAYDKLHRLRRRQSVRTHIEAGLVALAGEMVADLDLEVECHGSAPTWRYLVHDRGTDFDFLTDLALRAGYYLAVRERTLHLLSLEGFDDPIELELGDALLEAGFELGGEPPCRSVSVLGWDALDVRSHKSRADEARSGGWPDGVAGDPGSDWTLVDRPTANEDDALAAAQGILDERVARQVVLRGVASGDPRLRPGARLRVKGVGSRLAEPHVLTAVTHTIDARVGFISEVSSAPPPARAERTSSLITMGKITRVDDPEKRGRVKAMLPSYGELETEWMHVLSIGAGAKKGFTVLPDVNDTVLMAFAHEDPAQAVVLGGLYGEDGPSDSGVEGDAVKRFALLMPGGNALRMDGANSTIRLETGGGSYLEMAPKKVSLHSETDLVIEAPGKSLVISASTIDFRKE
jgi:phage baseplate assembly protein gpV/phage protein D